MILTLFGKKVFADIIQLRILRSACIERYNNPMTGVLIRDRREDAETQGEGHMIEGRDREDVATSLGTPGTPGSARGRKDPPLESWREHDLWRGTSGSRPREHTLVVSDPPAYANLLQQPGNSYTITSYLG